MRNLILHNPRCSKSRQTLELIQARGIDVDIVEYLQQPPTAAELAEICDLLDISPLQLIRTQEALFGELGLSRDNGYSEAQWLAVLAEHPRLIERPVLVYNGKAAIGRPPENVLDIL